MEPDEFNLQRFVAAQEQIYTVALQELRAGKKHSHWMWYIFPQLRGLGVIAASHTYGLANLAEARAYLAHPTLGPRLKAATNAILAHRSRPANAILGELDALKFKSCLTLFSLADPTEQVFIDALQYFFDGERDARTTSLLS